jgi:hypothetical protein
MGKNPDLDKLDDLFEKGKDFQLTGTLYEERTGVALPKSKNYIIKDSALARKAAEHGYRIADVCEKAVVVRTVFLKKEAKDRSTEEMTRKG